MPETETEPQDTLEYWAGEFKEARRRLTPWHEQARKVDDILSEGRQTEDSGERRLEVFGANLETREAMLYGRVPKASVERRFADFDDDVARVAAEHLERLLNTDIERRGDGFCSSLRNVLKDRGRAGWGLARARYVVETEETAAQEAQTGPDGTVLVEAVPAGKKKKHEDVETDHVHWEDQLWSPCRTFTEMRWWAQRLQLDRAELVARWPDKGEDVPLGGRDLTKAGNEKDDEDHPWGRADVWEVWDKDRLKQLFVVEGFGVLGTNDDPYELDGFWPFHQPLANIPTTKKFVPRPSYEAARDLHLEANVVHTRISKLTAALRVGGAYDASATEVGDILGELGDGRLIAVSKWAMFAEKGGFKGVVDWFPVEQVAKTLIGLREHRRELLDLIDQIEGTADIMRGAASTPNTSATEQSIKAKFGSARLQSLQDDFARCASELQHIRAQLIARFFDPATIKERAGLMMTPDAGLVDESIALIKSGLTRYRIEVKPENISLTDFAALKNERLEVMGAIGEFMTMLGSLVEQAGPQVMPFGLKMLKVTLAGLKGSSAYEGLIDQAVRDIEKAQQQAAANPQQAQPDPKVQAEQMKQQGEAMKAQAAEAKSQNDLQRDLMKLHAEVQADGVREQQQAEWNVREHHQKQVITNALRPEPQVSVKPKLKGKP